MTRACRFFGRAAAGLGAAVLFLLALAVALLGALGLVSFILSDANLDFGSPSGDANAPILPPLLFAVAYGLGIAGSGLLDHAWGTARSSMADLKVEADDSQTRGPARRQRDAFVGQVQTKPYSRVNDWSQPLVDDPRYGLLPVRHDESL